MTTRDTETLINDYAQLEIVIADLEKRKAEIEMDLRQQMETDGATTIAHPAYEVELKNDDNAQDVINGAAYVSKVKLVVTAKNPSSSVCPLCNTASPDGKPHAQCADWEQMLADRSTDF